jgi:DNA repair protein RadC
VGDARKPDPADNKPHYLGHRDRLRERFARGGADALADYELLELYLCLAIPRRDVKPLAKALLARFGGLSAVLAAPVDRLIEVKGLGPHGAQALKLAHALRLRGLKEEIAGRTVIGSWDALLDYCRAHLAHRPTEQVRVLFLDVKNGLIADEVQQEGSINHVMLYPREVVRRALALGAAAVILVHNHPSGDPTPSDADIKLTNEVVAAGKALGIAVHDHLIIGRGGHRSFRTLGLI